MNAKRSRAFGVLGIVGMGAACSVGEIDYEGKTCPCPSGYRCDDETNTCTKREASGGDGNGGGSGDESGGIGVGGSVAAGGDGSGKSGGSGSGNAGSGVGGSESGGTGLGGSGKGGSAMGGSATGGSATGGSATGGSATGGTGGTGVPFICAAPSACASLPNEGRNLVAGVFAGSPLIDCSRNCIDFLADILTDTEGDVEGSLDIVDGTICLNGRLGVDSSLDVELQPRVWDAGAHATSGFEFTIEGSDVPATMEAGYTYYLDADNPRCVVLAPPSGRHSVRLDSVRLECFTGVNIGTTTLTELLLVHFFIATTDSEETFDFCITGLQATR